MKFMKFLVILMLGATSFAAIADEVSQLQQIYKKYDIAVSALEQLGSKNTCDMKLIENMMKSIKEFEELPKPKEPEYKRLQERLTLSLYVKCDSKIDSIFLGKSLTKPILMFYYPPFVLESAKSVVYLEVAPDLKNPKVKEAHEKALRIYNADLKRYEWLRALSRSRKNWRGRVRGMIKFTPPQESISEHIPIILASLSTAEERADWMVDIERALEFAKKFNFGTPSKVNTETEKTKKP